MVGSSVSNTNTAAAIDVRTGRTSKRRTVVAADVEKQGVSTDGSAIVAFGIVGQRLRIENILGDSRFAQSFGRSGGTTILYEHFAF